MEIYVNNNVVVVTTEIPAAVIEDAGADGHALLDEKGNTLYTVKLAKGCTAADFSKFGFIGNAVIDGKVAAVIVEPIGTTLKSIKKKYGQAAIAAKQFLPIMLTAINDSAAAITEAFTPSADLVFSQRAAEEVAAEETTEDDADTEE